MYLEWPSQSPSHNIIEDLRNDIDQHINKIDAKFCAQGDPWTDLADLSEPLKSSLFFLFSLFFNIRT